MIRGFFKDVMIHGLMMDMTNHKDDDGDIWWYMVMMVMVMVVLKISKDGDGWWWWRWAPWKHATEESFGAQTASARPDTDGSHLRTLAMTLAPSYTHKDSWNMSLNYTCHIIPVVYHDFILKILLGYVMLDHFRVCPQSNHDPLGPIFETWAPSRPLSASRKEYLWRESARGPGSRNQFGKWSTMIHGGNYRILQGNLVTAKQWELEHTGTPKHSNLIRIPHLI